MVKLVQGNGQPADLAGSWYPDLYAALYACTEFRILNSARALRGVTFEGDEYVVLVGEPFPWRMERLYRYRIVRSQQALPVLGSAYDYSCDCSVPGCPHHRQA
jgi:hypothetical protein